MLFFHLLNFCETDQIFFSYFSNFHPILEFVTYDNLWNLQRLQSSYKLISPDNLCKTNFNIEFINQLEDLQDLKNSEAIHSVYHYSVPTVKLFYPEPFVAAPSFMHSDLWFVHILVYQYWLWFVFIFIIVFFVITFLCIVRWCNMRVRPRRETRGVSRSKCGDLITAIVPVSWAASIIISESTDAIDYFDGFGTTEMVIGIRAYQWGWEYYYPKDIDLNYNVKKNFSAFLGNSLKYNKSSNTTLHSNSIWKFYQNKPYDEIVTPAHLLLLPIDNYKILNFLNFSDVGSNAFHESSVFKHTRMMSKFFHLNLVSSHNEITDRYNKIAPLFISDIDIFDSYLYGMKRQHNLLNSKSISNSFSTFFNLKNVNKLLNYNYNYAPVSESFKGKIRLHYFNLNASRKDNFSWFNNNLTSFLFQSSNLLKFNKFLTYSSLLEKINNNSDKKKLKKPFLKVLSFSPKKINFYNSQLFNKNLLSSNSLTHSISSLNDFFQNNRITKKSFTTFSSNKFISKSQQTLKPFANLSVKRGNLNLSSSLNTSLETLSRLKSVSSKGLDGLNLFKKNKWINLEMTNKLLGNKIRFDSPAPVFLSNNPLISLIDFDDYKNSSIDNVFHSLQTRDELSSDVMFKTYWNLYFSNTNLSWRLNNSFNVSRLVNLFYSPFFTFSYDYDFRNWQTFSLLEDSYWENINSIYLSDEFAVFADEFEDYTYVDKLERFFVRDTRNYFPRDNVFSKPFFEDRFSTRAYYANSLFAEDAFPSSPLLPNWFYSIFPAAQNNFLMEDSFELTKMLQYLNLDYSKSSINFANILFSELNHQHVVDLLRSDIEDFSWFFNEKNTTEYFESTSLFIFKLIEIILPLWNVTIYKFLVSNPWTISISQIVNTSSSLHEIAPFFNNENTDFDFVKSLRFANHYELRATSKNAIGNYNAYQKVYKPRFDENRSHAKASDFANIYSKQVNLSVKKIRYDRLLGKNKEVFFQPVTFKNESLENYNTLYDSINGLNYYFFDFPFLLSLKSDASRYFWIDWFSRWGMFEVQPASSAKYAIMGLPHFNKNFDFNAEANEDIVDSESYFTRLARARRNYLPAWIHTPFLYVKNASFYRNHLFYEIFNFKIKNVTKSKFLLDASNWIFEKNEFQFYNTYLFWATNSNLNSFGRSAWNFSSPISAYYYKIANFYDILTKREYLYREFLFARKKVINMPLFALNNLKSELVEDLKSAFIFTDVSTLQNEYSRDVHYDSMKFYFTNILTFNLLNRLSVLGLPQHTINKLHDRLSENSATVTSFQDTLLKNQYRPLRKGITNMVRLHGTGAVAMPIEIRLQVLASSKDVIHSWAIPSAGVKIDCVPGYSSHRVLIFLVSGIFWGQCMEVCGRYHHWMPIIVYFMKRDLFFLWCTHFVFLSGANNMWVTNDRQFTNYARTVSFDKSTWINELK